MLIWVKDENRLYTGQYRDGYPYTVRPFDDDIESIDEALEAYGYLTGKILRLEEAEPVWW